MSGAIGGVISFDRGIDRIIQHYDEPSALPARSGFKPTGEQVRQRLSELVREKTLDDQVREWVRPEPMERDLLVPGRFDGEFHACRGWMREQAEATAHPLVARAAGLLEQEAELRQLFTSLRNLLIQA